MDNNKGVTLIELMIALVIAAILVGAIYSLFSSQQRTYTVQDHVVGVQQDARAALSIIAKDIRSAGFLTGNEEFVPAINGFSFILNPANNSGFNGTDQITMVSAMQEISTLTGVNKAANQVTFNDNVEHVSFLAFEGVNKIYRVNPPDSSGTTLTLVAGDGTPQEYTADIGANVFAVGTTTYQVVNGGVLQRNGQPLAGDGTSTFVEDLQFAYKVQGNAGWFNDPTTDFPAGMTEADIRMVRINIIVRTVVPDAQETGFFKPACEDHGQDNTNPGCRRRFYTTVVKVRNADL